MGKTRIAREITINAPCHEVWTALTDFGHVAFLDPNVTNSYLTSSQQTGVGATRHCDCAALGMTHEERITGWLEDVFLEVDVYDFEQAGPLKNMHEYFWLDDEGEQTVLRGIFEYELSNDVGSIINKLLIQRDNIQSWDELLAGTKWYVEKHKPVDRQTKLHIEDVRTLV